MSKKSSTRTIVGVCALACGLLAGPASVSADGVDDAKRKLDQVLAQLDALRDEMGQIDEDYAGALDRQEELVVEIAESQARVDEMTATLGDVQLVLQQIAIKRFTSGDSLALSPIFSNAATYSAAGQRSALASLALDTGEGNVDDLQSVVDDLAAERASLARKQEEATQLIASLETKRVQLEDLEANYKVRHAAAERDYGEAKLRAEQQARERAAAARAQRQRATNAPTGGAAPRGGGGGGGGSSGPTYTGTVPTVSGSAGIAVSAAYGQIGVAYRYAAELPGVAFDCSGLTKYAWGRAGVSLPHQSGRQFASTAHVPQDQVQPGDLIFYYAPIGHVGIYVGGGQMIHASSPSVPVELTTVNWNKVVGIGRPG
ncbi:MAG: C40 family peptidase [Actinobacteria bacterium]|nr:C40 family peptidase [Actinomycetota bacterium]